MWIIYLLHSTGKQVKNMKQKSKTGKGQAIFTHHDLGQKSKKANTRKQELWSKY